MPRLRAWGVVEHSTGSLSTETGLHIAMLCGVNLRWSGGLAGQDAPRTGPGFD